MSCRQTTSLQQCRQGPISPWISQSGTCKSEGMDHEQDRTILLPQRCEFLTLQCGPPRMSCKYLGPILYAAFLETLSGTSCPQETAPQTLCMTMWQNAEVEAVG